MFDSNDEFPSIYAMLSLQRFHRQSRTLLQPVQYDRRAYMRHGLVRHQHVVDDIQEAYSLTGNADYLLKAVLRDLKSLSDIVNHVLMPPQSVAHVRSSIVLDRLKESSKLPLKDLAR